ncbi:hypothetical protein IEO21_10761 [Rhodonia placenta]|uniref:Uncharacterized protein n=1 Tax=Rhodonia placenta TaxID=104341 RepID=A0A8H7TX50_9APHY|nr:hypothetical protein IEO21_10761 [Postia placenta]
MRSGTSSQARARE